MKLYQTPVPHYRWPDIEATLTPREKTTFRRWMAGQTCLLREDGTTGVYKWDWERWVAQGKKPEQGKDWD